MHRRDLLKTGIGTVATTMILSGASAQESKPRPRKEPSALAEELSDDPITHGGIQKIRHPQLGVDVHGQTSIRYLRFATTVALDHLELKRLEYGRNAPRVPTHPAHLTIDVLDRDTRRWQTIREVHLPADPRISGQGLSQEMSMEEMDKHFQKLEQEPPYVIELAGVKTDHLRVICDREHPVWPNQGECNGGPFNVPFGLLNKLKAFGTVVGKPKPPPYNPILQQKTIHPQAPQGMRVRELPEMLLFESEFFSIGFSLVRPLLLHLGWDALGTGESHKNRLLASRRIRRKPLLGGGSGPVLRTLAADYPSHRWTGEVSVEGNTVAYRNLRAVEGLVLDAFFTVEQDRVRVELHQTCTESMPVIEAEAWRLAWNLAEGITGMAGTPTLQSGRNGDVALPAMWVADRSGCLACRRIDGDGRGTRFQVESYRTENSVTGGFVFGKHPGTDQCQTLPAGKQSVSYELTVSNLEPKRKPDAPKLPVALQRHWATVFSCFRPEYRGFSNHSASVNCHLSQGIPMELVAHTRAPADGPNPLDLAKSTLSRALLDGGGYGYFRNLYLDSDPNLIAAAGRIYQAKPDLAWLRRIEPGLVKAAGRMLAQMDEKQGLLVCQALSGNSGSYRWSTNAMDMVGFGHIDAYVNAWAYRALRNAAAMLDDLNKNSALEKRCREAATAIRENYAAALINPQTGWVIGWKSRDGQLHDYAFTWVNGVATAFGVLEPKVARNALVGLEQKRAEAGPGTAKLGIPCNLIPIRKEDQMLGKMGYPRQSTFEVFTDGSLNAGMATYYLRALAIHGLKEQAGKLTDELEEGYVAGVFHGGNKSGIEFRSWEGLPTGYEGTLIGSFGPLYGIAIEREILQPTHPEWWPANG